MRKKILVVLSFLIAIAFVFFDTKSLAATESKIKVKRSSESVELDWNEVSPNFVLLDEENNILYKGTESYFNVKNLKPDSFYKFFLEFYNKDGQLVDFVSISTFTKKEKQKNKVNSITSAASSDELNPEVNLNSTSTVSSTKVEISWDSIEGVSQYDIYRDGVLVNTTQNTTYVDYTVEPNRSYIYNITGKRKVDLATETAIRDELATSNPDATEEEIQNMLYEEFDIVKDINTSTLNGWAAVSKKSFRLVYKTFIPDPWVKVPWYVYVGDKKIAYFSGDDRGFDIKSSKFRTRTASVVSFNGNNAPTTSFEKETNYTKAYNSSKVFIAEKKALTTGMKQSFWVNNSKQVNFLVSHSAYDPFLPTFTPAKLDYSYRAEFKNTGGYLITGSFDRAPSHEVGLALNGSTTYKILLNHKNEGLEMLTSNIPQKTFSASN